MAERKYYRATVHMIPPYASDYEEDVYAYSIDGALKSIEKYHNQEYSFDYVKEIWEILKDDFKGHHERN